MRFKVGDRVRIKSFEWYNENKDKNGNVHCGDEVFDDYMSVFCGSVVTIGGVYPYTAYDMLEDMHCRAWTDEMIEGFAEEETSQNAKLVSERFSEYVNPSEFKCAQDIITKMLLQGANISNEYILKDENGNIINAQKIILEKKEKEYPKTYEKCLKVLGYDDRETYCVCHTGADERLFENLYCLKVCRDAYWKIAGEEMGLRKPWKPNWEDENQEKHIIGSWLGTIQGLEENFVSHPLAFPTEEMRDAFYENFKELIEQCKELL